MSDEAKALRGERASALLTDPLIVEAFAEIERALFEKWSNTAPDDAAERERLFHLKAASIQFRDYLKKAVTDGKVSLATLKAARRSSK